MGRTDERILEAARLHQAGDLGAAEPLYRRILRDHPRHADALYLLGTLQFQRGVLGSAKIFLEKSIEAAPRKPEAHNNLGLVLAEQGDLPGARARFEEALRLDGSYADAQFNLANVLRESGQFEQADDRYLRAIALRPDFAEAHDNRAICLLELNRLALALEASDRAVALRPDSPVAHNNRGAILKALGRYREAAESFAQAAALRPGFPEALSNLGVTLANLGRFEEALERCQEAVTAGPESAVAHNNLGIVLHVLGRDADSAAACHRALELRPGFSDAANNLGIALHGLSDHAQAEKAYRLAIELDPQNAAAWCNLGSVLDQKGDVAGARSAFLKTHERTGAHPYWKLRAETLVPPVFESAEAIDEFRAEFARRLDEFLALAPRADLATLLATDVHPPFNLQFHGKNERPIRERYAKIVSLSLSHEPPGQRGGDPRIGFFVTHGHEWAFLRSIGGFFERFSSGWRPTILCSPRGAEKIRAAIANPAVEFLPLSPAIEHAAAEVRGGFDLLYHWEIATSADNYLLPYLRLAPVQTTSWGIQVTSGIPAMDYYLSSRWVEPPDGEEHYTETLIRLETMLSWQRRLRPPADPRPKERFVSAGRRMYLCAQHLGKFHPDFDAILRGILEGDPEGEIVVTRSREEPAVGKLVERWTRTLGPWLDRVRFVGVLKGDDYFSAVLRADVVLDPIHFGGVNTTYDALSYHRPVVTLPSGLHRGRYTLGCLRYMGATETVAASPEDYVAIAVRLGRDEAYRKSVEENLAARSHVLFENEAAARELEAFLVEAALAGREGRRLPAR